MILLSVAIELAIDAEDLRFLVVMAIVLLLGAAAAIGLAVMPWRAIERPAGLDDWRRGVEPSKPWPRR